MSYTPVNWWISNCLFVCLVKMIFWFLLHLDWKCHSEPGLHSHWWLHHWPQSPALSWESRSAAYWVGWSVTTNGQTSTRKTSCCFKGSTKQGSKFCVSHSLIHSLSSCIFWVFHKMQTMLYSHIIQRHLIQIMYCFAF